MIYLDIDGVLIPDNAPDDDNGRLHTKGSHVAWIAKTTGMPIVLSSHRRRSSDVHDLLRAAGLSEFLFQHDTLWRTPLDLDDLDDDLSIRGQEIERHRQQAGVGRHLVIDDMPVLSCHTHLAIDPARGITFADRSRAQYLLDGISGTIAANEIPSYNFI